MGVIWIYDTSLTSLHFRNHKHTHSLQSAIFVLSV